MNENELATKIIGVAMDVHTKLGPGLLEAVYKECLYYKLKKLNYEVEKEKVMPVFFEEIKMDHGYRIDLLVNKQIVIELKSVEALNDVHLAQTLTYLKMGDFKLGLLMNFNVARLKDGLRRVINGQLNSVSSVKTSVSAQALRG
jgi:GxxExxY protein